MIIRTFVSKLMSLLFNTLSRFAIAILPRNKHLLIFWLQSSPTLILKSKKRKSDTVYIFSPSICHEVIELDAMIFVFWMLSLFFFSFIFVSWRLITLQYCSVFCYTLIWISHGFTCIPHPDPPSHLPLHPIPLGFPSAPGRSSWALSRLFHSPLSPSSRGSLIPLHFLPLKLYHLHIWGC